MHGDVQVVRGTIGDRSWGALLGGLGVAGRTVQITVRSEDKVYRIAMDRGLVVAASSPNPADAVARIAVTGQFIAPAQQAEIKRALSLAPNQDDVDVCVATAKLDAEQSRALRVRVVTQRAARTFSIDEGTYEIEDRMPIPIAGWGIDIRSVIFTGARMFLSEARLGVELKQFGARFVMKPSAITDVERFNFGVDELSLLDTLATVTSLAELEVQYRDVDPRAIQAVIYALGACNAIAEVLPTGAPPPLPPPLPATTTLPPPVAASPPPPAEPVAASFPDANRVSALLHAQNNPLATARVPTVQITERVRTSTKMSTVRPDSRDELPPERARKSTLVPPIARTATTSSSPPSQPLVPRATKSTISPLSRPRTVTPREDTLDEPTKERGFARAHHESNESSFKGLAEGTPSIDKAAYNFDEISETAGAPFEEESPTRARTPFSRDAHVTVSGKPVPDPSDRSMLDVFKTSKVTTVRPNALQRHEVIALINQRTMMLNKGVDHFALLGLPMGAEIEDVHAAYVELSRHLNPQRLAELNIRDEAFIAQSLLAQIGIAFTVLTDRERRPEYMAKLRSKRRNDDR